MTEYIPGPSSAVALAMATAKGDKEAKAKLEQMCAAFSGGLSPSHAAQRIGRITSSTAAACLGLSKWMSPLDAWLRIRGDHQDEDSAVFERGRMLEPVILRWGANQIGADIQVPHFVTHDDHDWLGDSVDCIYVANGQRYCGEAKSVGMGSAVDWGEEGTDQIPNDALVQSHIHLICHPDTTRCAVPALIADYQFGFKLYWVDRDEKLHATLINRLGAWWEKHIRDNVRPEPVASDEDTLRDLFPNATAAILTDATKLAEVVVLAEEYAAARAKVKEAEEAKGLAGAKLREILGEYDSAKFGDASVTYRNTAGKTRIDWEAVAKALGAPDDLVQQHTTVSAGHRALRVTVKETSK